MTAESRVRSLDLQLDVKLPHRRGRSDQLTTALRKAIESGRLPPGARLPSTRGVASDLGLARGTVISAYHRLVAEGLLETAHGSGTRVAADPPRVLASARRQAAAGPGAAWRWDLRPGLPDITLFPRGAWARATQRVLTEAPAGALDYGDPRGQPELRRALADYLGRTRGVVTHPDRIIVCHGFTQALGLVAGVLAEQGVGTVSVEDPCYPLFREVVRLAGLRAHPVGVDERGLLPSRLRGGAVVVTPIHQYPLGAALAGDRRRELVAWAEKAGAVIVEDDYDGEFQYGRRRVGALQALAPHRVLYAGTTSKTLAPGLRLAWLAVPPEWVEPITAAKRIADQHSAALTQMVFTDLLRSGTYDRHIRKCRDHYRERRDRLGAMLAREAPAARLVGEDAGLHTLVRWDADGPAEREVLLAARRESLAVTGLSAYWGTTGPHPPGLVVGYGSPPQHGYAGALGALARALRRCFTG
ncbi:PLP-dependent aminotransferase family protein [Streptomyces sp. NRRL F-5727]|uniref:MocR-like pyridoxine biosynthesis transcription factor PdxR n=1 Tax=Streptomyces sp. NRRL F-5727 TaxID=1463871 RepID=UPI0004C6D7C2|nr:PLP-dependent aminotransferase family protein [Streptomyces sp. NRRL F-5727]